MSFKTRIQNKRDTSANWEMNDPVLLDGELIIVDTSTGDTRFKIGDGTKTYTQLPFQDELYETKDEANSKLENAKNYTDVEIANAVEVLDTTITAKYSADNPPPYPVTSCQGKTGDVTFATETWTFTLVDGTTIDRKVLLE